MASLLQFVERMNVMLWLAVIFLFHLILYLSLGTDDWLVATVLATAVYAVVLLVAKSFVRRSKGVR